MRSFAVTHDLRRRAESECRQFLRSMAAGGELAGMSLEYVDLVFEQCELVFDHGELSYPFVETRLGLYMRGPVGNDGTQRVGHYRLITMID